MNIPTFLKKLKNRTFIVFFNQNLKNKIHIMFTKCKIINPAIQKNKFEKVAKLKTFEYYEMEGNFQ